MNVIELERHADRRAAGDPRFAHFDFVVITRGGMVQNDDRKPTYTVWLSMGREVGESRFCLTQTKRLGWASAVARACASETEAVAA
jgi:hypothetical protein